MLSLANRISSEQSILTVWCRSKQWT